MNKLVIATNNAHKLEEIRAMLGDTIQVLSLADIDCHDDIPETADTLEGNALQKARYIHEHYGVDCFADDTGLEVTALGGRPGVHTARYAYHDHHDPEANNTKLLQELADKEDRTARFRTVIALIEGEEEHLFEGIVEGEIVTELRGEEGFGYDPIFAPCINENERPTQTFAQLGVDVKNTVSHRARAVSKLVDHLRHAKHLIIMLCIMLAGLLPQNLMAQWAIYNSYRTLTDAIDCGGVIYGLYEGGLLLNYDTKSTEVRLLSKTTGLSDASIKLMDYSSSLHILALVYDNGNIDLLNTQTGRISNMPQYKQYPDEVLSLNALRVNGQEALLCTAEGVMRITLSDASIRGYYRLGATKDARLADNYIYAQLQDGDILRCNLKTNALDLNNWEMTELTVLPGSVRNNAAPMQTLRANISSYGPSQRYHLQMRWSGNRLLTVNGRVDATGHFRNPINVTTYDGKRWGLFSTDYSKDPYRVGNGNYLDASDVLEDPRDTTHVYVSSGGMGLLEYRHGVLTHRHTPKNSLLRSRVKTDDNYTRVSALAFDLNNNLWMANVGKDTVMLCLKADGTWTRKYIPSLVGCTEAEHMLCDAKNRLWLADRRFAGEHRGGVLCYDQEADKSVFRNEFINEDGSSLSVNEVFCIAEEHEGQFWVGTNAGLLVIERPDEWFNEDFLITQIKVPRNDGTNYADYLLAGVGVTAIAVDGANRKWIGTQTDGIYLVSANGTEILEHFTSDDSPLLSNYIYSIAIDGNSGEVFIATDRGLQSYGGTATDPTSGLSQSNLHIYPNPLRPDSPRQINIHGLTADAEVKIVSLSGQVVNRGKSIGGAYQWDATDMRGNPCATGVYIVAVSTEDGKTAVAGKFAIVR